MPDGVDKHIVCRGVRNLDQFGLPNIHSFKNMSRWEFINMIAYALPQLRVHFRRQVGILLWVAKRTKANILHSHFGNMGWWDMKAAKKANLKHIVTFYGQDVTRLPKVYPVWLERYREMFQHVDCVLCEGSHMKQAVMELGCPEHKVKVHHLGIRIEKIPFRPRRWMPNTSLRVLIAASFREKKGIPYAIQALGRLQNDVALEITVIGDATSAAGSRAEKKKIIATVNECNLKEKLRFLGFQPYNVMLAEAYKHHIFLSPSVTASDGDSEGGAPVSIIEMAASGMLVVSTYHCDIPGVINNRVTGLLAPERDVDGLVGHLKWSVINPEKWGEMLQASRTHIQKEFNAHIQGERLFMIYRDILA